MNRLVCFLVLILTVGFANAQELNARVTINTANVSSTTNKNTFVTLQSAVNNFLNSRKWTNDTYLPNERIDCSFLLTLQTTADDNVFSASLTVQSARPVFNTSYLSPIINFQDKDIIFRYIQFQQLEFNDNRVTGSEPLISNLTATLAYYAYMIIAFDKESFAPRGGEVIFQKAQNIVNNAPDGRGITGWKAFDGIRNRYWLVENMLNTRYAILHDVYYNYYRMGLDNFTEDDKKTRAEVLNVLNLMNNFNSDNPNTMINQFFFQGKSTELIFLFSKATPQDKARALELLQKIDLTNATRYKEELK